MKNHIFKTIFSFLTAFLVFSLSEVSAQDSTGIRITGIVLDADSLDPVPYTAVAIKNSNRGTISDNSGYFSLLVQKFDTLIFSGVGYRESTFIVPNLVDEGYSLIQLLSNETVLLDEVEVMAWPDEASFVKAFHSLNLKKTEEIQIFEVREELNKVLEEQYENDKFYYEQMRYSKLYNTTGFVPPNNFLNPLRWSNFIRDWKNGEFKSKR